MSAWYVSKGPQWDVVLSSRVRLARDIDRYLFPNRMKPHELTASRDEICQAIGALSEKEDGDFVTLQMDLLPHEDRAALVEKHLISDDLAKGACGRAACISRDEAVSILINEEDHIRIQVMEPGFNVREAYAQAQAIAIRLERQMPIAFSAQYGFLTACPTNTGTGLRASVMVHLPALTHTRKLVELVDGLKQAGFVVRGYRGENSHADGNMYQLSNQITLGISEEDILCGFEAMVADVIDMERQLRKDLYKREKIKIEDSVYRSYGELLHARMMSQQEAMQRISNLRLGIALGFFNEHDEQMMAKLTSCIGVASIQKLSGALLSQRDRDIKRADTIRQMLNEDRDRVNKTKVKKGDQA